MTITRDSLRTAVALVKFFLLMVVISVVIRIGLSLVLPPHWAAVGQLMGTLAFGLCILLSPLRPRYFQYPSVRDQEKVPQDNEQPHGELYFVGSDNRSLYRLNTSTGEATRIGSSGGFGRTRTAAV